ncbi:ferritin-like domain-containing protein [Komarekiella sp. 'clone 1']|uniref:Ferritin-like domain-containing protein n=1 Tax=Komarekiella delphini-convector SJRDD-AB1 TaxID=2593771 RepID=A0AA40SSS6_9NOST|nr:ferritin-like domain-containing protein [Komarekiella delphini-convector]MBD6614600.1 ferritin-like domain-containing protein [Komarekiella delphini-convector SJRDD-AB1]
MLKTLSQSTEDLAAQNYTQADYFHIQRRVHSLINSYLTAGKLHDRLRDLQLQLQNPQSRPWKPIDWQTINRDQIIGIDPKIFLSILIGAMDTEAPIRGYTQTSRQYLEKLHPQMARFVGGTVDENDELLELGLWEKEERQHTPALIKIYMQLTGEKITPKLRTVRGYLPSNDPNEDLYRHGLHRVATEYGATCLYLWLMAHTTGALQDVLEELAQDEINHMTKFWGFGVWAFPDTSLMRIGRTLIKTRSHNYKRNNLLRTLRRMMETLNWNSWTLSNKTTLIFTFIYAMRRLWVWNKSLTPEYLDDLFGINH